MTKMENAIQADERRLLKRYLARYFRAKEKQAVLQDRLGRLRSELGGPSGKEATGTVSEIEARIQRQTALEEKSILEIMDVLDLLPSDSTERSILELRHIDCKPWREIHRAVHLTRSPCFDYYNRGLDQLLAMREVRLALGLCENSTGG